MVVKQVTEVSSEFLAQLESDLKEIKTGLRSINVISQPEYITAGEFLKRISSSRWVLDELIKKGSLRYRKVGRKIYIQSSEVTRFFEGDLKVE